jgi:hypothetical protein
MRFRYIGDSKEMVAFGYDFRNGGTPEVTDPHAIGKLSGNRFFEAVFVMPAAATAQMDVLGQATGSVFPVKNKGGRPRKNKQPTEA